MEEGRTGGKGEVRKGRMGGGGETWGSGEGRGGEGRKDSDSKHWFTTSFLGGRCRKAMLGVWERL